MLTSPPPRRRRAARTGALVAIIAGGSVALRGTATHLSHSQGGVVWSDVLGAASIVLLIVAVVLLAIAAFRRNR